MKDNTRTAVKVICVFNHNGKTLASRGYDSKKNETFYRGIGGGVHFRETSENAIRREVKEELGSDVENLELLTVSENIFTYNGKNMHQIIFLYEADLSNKDLYNQDKIKVTEPHSEFDAEWVSVNDILSGKTTLYPSLDWSRYLRS